MPIKARPVSVARAAAFARGQVVFVNDDNNLSATENMVMTENQNFCYKQEFTTTKHNT